MEERKVAILMATYNGEQFLEKQINSILNQTYKNWTLIVHDDGSEDATVHILKRYASKYPERIVIIDDGLKFANARDNFNHLMGFVVNKNFDYIFFCDQDDVWLPDKVALFVDRFEIIEESGKNLPVLLHSDLKVVDSRLRSISSSMWRYQKLNPEYKTLNYLLVQNNVTGCACAINRHLLKLSYPVGKRAVMHDWWIALVASAFGVIDFIARPTVLYRQHGRNDTGAKGIDFRYAVKKAKRKEELLNSIKRTVLQAQDFLAVYGNLLNPQYFDMVKSYSEMAQYSYLKKLYAVFCFRFFKQNFLRNIGYLWYLRYLGEDTANDFSNHSNL